MNRKGLNSKAHYPFTFRASLFGTKGEEVYVNIHSIFLFLALVVQVYVNIHSIFALLDMLNYSSNFSKNTSICLA
jgi:hypothetical protein